jgi:AAA family ATP:ADP antiporter
VALIWGVLYSMAWLLAGDVIERRSHQGRIKAYGVIGSFAITGGLAGGVLARMFAPYVAPDGMVRIAALAVAVSAFLLRGVRSNEPDCADCRESGASSQLTTDPEPPLRTVLRRLLRSRYGYLLLGVGMAAGLVGELLEFQFYLAAVDSGGSIADDASHFARIYAVLNGGALVLQVLLLPRLHGRIGVGGGLLVLPAILVGASGAMIVGVSAWGVSALRAVEGGLKSSIHRPNWEQAYLTLSRAERSVAKLLVDGIGIRLAEGFGAVLLWLWLSRQPAGLQAGTGQSTLLAALFVASATWLALGWNLRRGVIAYAGSRPVPDTEDFPVPLPECCHVTAVLGRNIRNTTSATEMSAR